MKKQTRSFIILFLMVVIVIIIALIRRNELKKNYVVISGKVTRLETFRGGVDFFVHFKFENKNLNQKGISSIPNSSKSNDFAYLDSVLKNQSLPVIYQKDNIGNNKMLFSKEECEKYKVQLSPQEERIINTIDSLGKK